MTLPFLLRRFCIAAIILAIACPLMVQAQVDSGDEVPDVTRTYAIVGATVIKSPGTVLENTTVLIRDGLIAAVGQNINLPFDAQRIEADSLTVYAGFIDGLSYAGIPAPKPAGPGQQADRPDDPGYPSDEEAGILPGRDVRTLIKAEDKSVADMRKSGFTAAHIVPRGRMLPGTGAIILLSDDNDANALVYKGETSVFAQFASARRMYPGTDMAVIAKMRQLMREAERRQHVVELYEDNPTGISRPSYDPTHYSLFPVLDGERRVFFHTEDVLDVHRALSLQEELGFGMVLTGVNQGYEAMDKLKAANIPLMITLDLPEDKSKKEPPRKEDDAEEEEEAPTDSPPELPEPAQPSYNPQLRVNDLSDLEEEKKNLEARRDAARMNYLENAGKMASEGIDFGFTSVDTKAGDMLPNIRTLIENGLSEDDALAALTTNPARILGVSATMGTVEAGKMGNLVVATGNVFDEDTHIQYVFIDGRKYEFEKASKAPGSNPDAEVTAAGTWSFTVLIPGGGEDSGVIQIDQDLNGTISSALIGDVELSNISLEGNELKFSFETSDIGLVNVLVTISGDEFSGEATVPQASIPINGTRTSTPEL